MPVSLWRHIAAVRETVCAAEDVWIGLDFDGTLAPIVPDPNEARLPAHARAVLSALCRTPHVQVAVLTGRALHDIQARLSIGCIAIAANHGMEIKAPGFWYEDNNAVAVREKTRRIAREVTEALNDIPGLQIETKDLSFSVHYRQVDRAYWRAIAVLMRSTLAGEPQFHLRGGRRVWEVVPAAAANKGDALRTLLARAGGAPLPIYFGDDITDEDAFDALPQGITAIVGKRRNTRAQYYVDSPADVYRFLQLLMDSRA